MYGLTDKQLRRFFKMAKKMEGSLSDNLMLLLERRLDNMVYRMNFAPTRRAARQLVSHGHVKVNGKRLDIPSALVNSGDKIELATRVKGIPLANMMNECGTPEFVEVDVENKVGLVKRFPFRSEITQDINEVYVVEWYKRLV
ncbi:30S ribosomal protein S4-like [Rattus rattus]|uniref:30S ribosomal protein S4-like n=1 Tax=Rattus rattus TaxID=10117 RepID=UPI0013F2D098|nr:30S ribosomal protein S4-like [Rattus rattus]